MAPVWGDEEELRLFGEAVGLGVTVVIIVMIEPAGFVETIVETVVEVDDWLLVAGGVVEGDGLEDAGVDVEDCPFVLLESCPLVEDDVSDGGFVELDVWDEEGGGVLVGDELDGGFVDDGDGSGVD